MATLKMKEMPAKYEVVMIVEVFGGAVSAQQSGAVQFFLILFRDKRYCNA